MKNGLTEYTYVSGCTFPQLMGHLKSNVREECLCIDPNKGIVVNPKNGNVLCVVEDYLKRKRVCDKLYRDTGLENFKFCNQSPAAISKNCFWLINGTEYRKSSYNKSVLELVDNYSPRANSRTIRTKERY